MTTATLETKTKPVSLAQFGIEADHPRNSDLLMASIGNVRLRSSVKATKIIIDREDGEQVTRPEPAGMISGLPANMPGMQLHVNAKSGKWKVIDPLEKDEETLRRIKRAMDRENSTSSEAKLRGVKPKAGQLDADGMKTLIREMLCFVEAGEARVCSGVAPTREQVDALPGKYLTNPNNLGHWSQPKYEEEIPAWRETLNRLPG